MGVGRWGFQATASASAKVSPVDDAAGDRGRHPSKEHRDARLVGALGVWAKDGTKDDVPDVLQEEAKEQ